MSGESRTDHMELRFTSDPRLLCVARASVRRFVELAGFQEQGAENIVLAVDEAITNVIRHGYSGRSGEPIELELMSDHLEDDDLLEMVNAGLIPMVVVDNHKAEFWAQIFNEIRLHTYIAANEGR